MKTIFVRKFHTKNIVTGRQKNFRVTLILDFEKDISFFKEDKIKYNLIEDNYVEVKGFKYNLDESIKEISLESKELDAKTEQEFLSELQPYKDKGWYEK